MGCGWLVDWLERCWEGLTKQRGRRDHLPYVVVLYASSGCTRRGGFVILYQVCCRSRSASRKKKKKKKKKKKNKREEEEENEGEEEEEEEGENKREEEEK